MAAHKNVRGAENFIHLKEPPGKSLQSVLSKAVEIWRGPLEAKENL